MSTAVAASLSPSENSSRKAPIKLVPQGADCGTLQGRELAGADLSNLDLSGADLSGVNLSGTDFSGTTLFEADLSGAEMLGANLTGANLTRCNCHSVGLGNANLTEANFFGADLRNATLSGSVLKDADLRTADLRGARLVEADLDGATFQSADLRDASLRRARCRGTVFDRVDFGGACLRELKESVTATWIEARISQVDFCGAYLLRRAICDQNYLHEFRRRGFTHAAIYWIWWLTSDCGRSLARWGACIASVVFLFGLFFRVVAVDFGSHETWLSPYYYSLVTLTSLGYGDVLPVSVGAQAVAMAEVALGYMMLGGMLSIFSNMMARRAD